MAMLRITSALPRSKYNPQPRRILIITRLLSNMSDLEVKLTAPNGKQFTLHTGLFIDNLFVKASSEANITSINPTNEEKICSVEAAGADDIDKAVDAARKAFNHESWRDLSGSDRGKLMYKLADLMEENTETLSTIETWDNGKPYNDSLSIDVPESISTIRYYAGYADKIHGKTIPTSKDKFAYTIKQPIGVCGQIIPWNFPLAMAAWKIGPAIACGNTIVLKPAEQTPLSALFLANLVREAGFPPGVINVVNGYGREAGQALASHLGVDKIAFTGSTATGRHIMKTASINLKNVTLETGGKSPLLVFPDADMEQAAKWAHIGIMSNMGQICTATSRILVHDSVYDTFIAKFREVIKSTSKVGDPFAKDTFQGPQVTQAQYDKILNYVDSGKSEGATLTTGGKPCPLDGKGYFIEPTIFTNVTRDMKIYREEVFGPFCVIASFKTEEEAINMANDTTYGLGSAIFSQNIQLCHRVAARIDSGTVWINSSQDSDYRVPFGGFKQSGIGRELGEAGLWDILTPLGTRCCCHLPTNRGRQGSP
jgi:aldehyde dehydrogenase (NAD+)